MTRVDLYRIGVELIKAVDDGYLTTHAANTAAHCVANAASAEPAAMGLISTTAHHRARVIALEAIREGYRDSSHRQNRDARRRVDENLIEVTEPDGSTYLADGGDLPDNDTAAEDES